MIYLFAVGGMIILLDQVSKLLILHFLPLFSAMEISNPDPGSVPARSPVARQGIAAGVLGCADEPGPAIALR